MAVEPRPSVAARVEPPAPPGERAAGDVTLEARGLSRRYGDLRALEDFGLRLSAGEILGLLGPNGAGKTGTAELRPTANGPPDPRNTDAWFLAFAPATRPQVAVAVMLVGAGAGGAAAAPIARRVLEPALR